MAKGYVARRNTKFRPKAFSIVQERVVQAWHSVRHGQLRVDIANARDKRAGTSRLTVERDADPVKSDVSRNSFEKFAAKYFQHGNDAKHTTNEIIRPLLNLQSGVDQKVKQRCSVSTSFLFIHYLFYRQLWQHFK